MNTHPMNSTPMHTTPIPPAQPALAAVERYGWADATAPASCDYLVPQVLAMLAGLGVRRVLDLGCGNGALCARMAAAGYEVCGVDADAEGVARARASHAGLAFHRFGVHDDPADLLALQAPFDLVVSTEVVEHLYAPHLLPAYAQRVLVPGGRLLLTTPYHGYLKNLALALVGKWDDHHTALWHGGHIKFWSRRTLTRLLDEGGFEVERFAGAGRLPYLWKSMVLLARRRDAAGRR